MPAITNEQRRPRITWQFQLAEQGSSSRYGVLGFDYYKQYLPGGLVLPIVHPPKRISEQLYNLAKRRFEGNNPEAASE
jgi:hypothetical protein